MNILSKRIAWIVAAGGVAILLLGIAFHVVVGRPVATPMSANVGGPFTLVNHEGRTVTNGDFAGRYMLLYFGYTFCPDVCPTSLSTIAEAIEILGHEGRDVVPLFISIDPGRDTPEHLASYIRFFHPRFVALTGTTEQVAAVARAFRVYYAKVPEESGDEDAYMMDHSSIVFLMGPDGRYLTHFGHETSAQEMATRVASVLKGAS